MGNIRIDSHQHFWYYSPERESWIPDEMSKIRKDFLPMDLLPVLDKNRMDGCILVQADDSEVETELLLDFASRHSFVKGVVGWVELRSENVMERLIHYSENPLLKGIRHTLQAYPAAYMLEKPFKNGLGKLSQFNLTFDLLVLEHQLETAVELVKAFPQQTFILDHLAKPSISRGISRKWVHGINELGAAGNVWCKVSGFLVETENFNWAPEEFTPFFEVVFQAFGEERLMYGSDWPVCLAAGEYEDTLRPVEHFFSTKGENVLGKIMGENATLIYRL